MVQSMVDKEQTGQMQKLFMALDTNKDGYLDRDEIFKGYSKMYGEDVAQEEVDKIFSQVDVDHSGQIDFSEFVAASINKELLLDDEKLKAAYNYFDRDGCGHLKMSELKEVLGVGKNISDKVWKEIIKEVAPHEHEHGHGDGHDHGHGHGHDPNEIDIHFEDFKRMME